MTDQQFNGVISPLLTPFDDDFALATSLFIDHAAWSLEQGLHYIAPFGTTGEAVSVGMRERMDAMEALAASGIAPARMMPGTGLCALPDTVELCRHAVDLGCAAVMVLPPFYYPFSDDGLVTYYSRLIDAVGADQLRICLYHIPQMSGVAVSPDVVARLNRAFPQVVVAYKDSSGNWENTMAVIDAAPEVSVFPASENMLQTGLAYGAAGCISATLNTQASVVRAAYDALVLGDTAAYAALADGMIRHRNKVQTAGFIPALKSMMAAATGEARWRNIRPPSDPAPTDLGAEINAELGWSR
ncbi:MAG: dihydrodipicolinate synthase family protein [Rhodobacteraceae bacterium]|nr:dihydrodipicolinate synthase family protein [Paracoccaceae bacterium]